MQETGQIITGILIGAALIIVAIRPWITKKNRAQVAEEQYTDEKQYIDDPGEVDYPFTSAGPTAARNAQNFIVFDVETTGLSPPRDDKIIELTALKVRDGNTTRFSTLVNPGRRIPKKSSSVHGITDSDVNDAPAFNQIVRELDAFLDPDLPIVGHNVTFDLRFLWWAYHDTGRELTSRAYIDTYKLSRRVFKDRNTWSLGSLIHDYGLIEGEQTHRTDDDVNATLALLQLCREKM